MMSLMPLMVMMMPSTTTDLSSSYLNPALSIYFLKVGAGYEITRFPALILWLARAVLTS